MDIQSFDALDKHEFWVLCSIFLPFEKNIIGTSSYYPQGQIQAQEGEGVGLLRPCHPRLCEAFNINFGSFVQHLALSPKE